MTFFSLLFLLRNTFRLRSLRSTCATAGATACATAGATAGGACCVEDASEREPRSPRPLGGFPPAAAPPPEIRRPGYNAPRADLPAGDLPRARGGPRPSLPRKSAAAKEVCSSAATPGAGTPPGRYRGAEPTTPAPTPCGGRVRRGASATVFAGSSEAAWAGAFLQLGARIPRIAGGLAAAAAAGRRGGLPAGPALAARPASAAWGQRGSVAPACPRPPPFAPSGSPPRVAGSPPRHVTAAELRHGGGCGGGSPLLGRGGASPLLGRGGLAPCV